MSDHSGYDYSYFRSKEAVAVALLEAFAPLGAEEAWRAARTAIADGLACRTPNPQAMEVIWENVARIVQVSDQEIAAAMRAYYQDTHNLAEGAGAAALAGALQECRLNSGGRIGVVLTGGNVDREAYQAVLGAEL